MTKSLLTETLRSIRRTKARFISIIAIVALGISFFAGIKATYPDMNATAKKYFNNNRLMDIWMVSTIGFSDEDVEAVNRIPGVENAVGSKFADTGVSVNGKKLTDIGGSEMICRVYGLDTDLPPDSGDYLNRLNLLDGRLPEKPSECVVDNSRLSTPEEFVIGNKISVTGFEESLDTQLNTTEFTIVGVIETPRYVSSERGQTTVGQGSLNCFIYVPLKSFSLPFYTELCVRMTGSEKYDPYSDEYFNAVKSVADKIESISKSCIPQTAQQVKAFYSEELDNAKAEYAQKENQLKAELGDAYIKLEDGKRQIAEAEAQLNSAKQTAQREFSEKYGELSSGESDYSNGIKEYNSKYNEYLAGKQQIEDAESKISAGETQVAAIKIIIASNENTLSTLNEQIAQSEKAIENYNSVDINYNNLISETEQSVSVKSGEVASLTEQLSLLDESDPDYYIKSEELQGKINSLENEITELNNQKNTYLSEKAHNLTLKNSENENLTNLKSERTSVSQKISSSKSRVEQLNKTIENGKTELAAGKATLEKSKAELDEAKKTLEAAGLKIQGGWDEYNKAYEKAQGEILTNSSSLAQAKAQLQNSIATYSANEEQLYSKLDEARYKIEDSEKKINDAIDVENAQWYVNDRNSLPGYEGYGQTAENMKAFAQVFPLFFFVVAALVCLTTMTRMVDEERTQLGTLKALGYSRGDIQKKYLIYAFSASIIGSAIGVVIGLYLYPIAIFRAYGIMYSMPKLEILFPLQFILTGTFFAVFSTLLVTYIACRKEMKDCPASLMRPKAPKAGKRVLLEKIPFIWNRASFTSKVTIRNIFRNKKRFFMTLIGIAGCSALILTGFGLKDSINAIIGKQFSSDGITQCDSQVAFKNSQTTVEGSKAYNVIINEPGVAKAMMFYSKSVEGYGKDSENTLKINLFVPQDKMMLHDFIDLRDRRTGEKFELTDDGTDGMKGVIITEKFAKVMGLGVGDCVNLKIDENTVKTVPISAVVENYTYHYAYMSPERYEALFGEMPKFNYAYASYTDEVNNIANDAQRQKARSDIATDLMKYNDINAVIDAESISDTFSTMFDSLDSVIVVFIVSAAALAFIVLYNLTNININERQREIATLKVLGFYDSESTNYIGRENMSITVMGIILGLVGGIFLHKFVIAVAEVNVVMFGRSIEPLSFLSAVLLTLLFSLLVSIVMHFRIKKIHMVESLKSIE